VANEVHDGREEQIEVGQEEHAKGSRGWRRRRHQGFSLGERKRERERRAHFEAVCGMRTRNMAVSTGT
jgi:hypothetical protein